MKTLLFIALIAMVMTGLATAEVDMTIYDRNMDGMIDSEERITLDIDIEDCRLTQDESYVIDSYTTDGTIILNDEFKAMFLNAGSHYYETEEVAPTYVDPVDPAPIEILECTMDEKPEVTPTIQQEDNNGANTTLLYLIVFIIILAAIIYFYVTKKKE